MLNRTQAPEIHAIDRIDFVAPEKHHISKTCVFFHMKDVPNDTARFDLYFNAGKCHSKGGVSSFVNALLLSGTDTKSAVQIQDEINRLGGFFESGVSMENAVVSMYCLRENVLPIFRILMDAIQNVSFHEKEVSEMLSDRKQKFRINQEKVSFLAQQHFCERLFASNVLYAAPMTLDQYDTVTIDELRIFHERYYKQGLEKVVLVGNVDPDEADQIKAMAVSLSSTIETRFDDTIKHQPGHVHIPKEGALQSAVRVGRMLFNKKHPDYIDFLVLNTILGDYFGSRLMTNIREDKGYTYGIGSVISELGETGYFMVATEVGSDKREATLKEIQFELERLQQTLVSEDELDLVKSYMIGQLLKSADGPYAMTDLFLSAVIHGKDLAFYNEVIQRVHAIDAQRIQELATSYLQWENMTIVTVG